jgi:hypothetical protein
MSHVPPETATTNRFAFAAAAATLWLAGTMGGAVAFAWASGPAILFVILSIAMRPAWLRRADQIFDRFTRPVRLLISEVALLLLYFVLLTPLGLLLRVCGRDALRMRHFNDAASASGWHPRAVSNDAEQLFRMF